MEDTMGIAAYNNGSRVIAAEVESHMPAAQARADRQAHKDEIERLKNRVAQAERKLARARRCLAAERYARAKREGELKTELKAAAFSTSVLCRLAFGDKR
jgi:DNA helicase IV